MLGLFTVLYVRAHRYSVDFEFRRESHSVTLVQLPLALGVVFVGPVASPGWRGWLRPLVLAGAAQRQPPMQGAVQPGRGRASRSAPPAYAVGLVAGTEPGPELWFALYIGLLAR